MPLPPSLKPPLGIGAVTAWFSGSSGAHYQWHCSHKGLLLGVAELPGGNGVGGERRTSIQKASVCGGLPDAI